MRAAVLDEQASSPASLTVHLLRAYWLRASEEGSGSQRAIRARDVRAADLQEEPTKRASRELMLRHIRFVGSDEDGGSQANIAASGASH